MSIKTEVSIRIAKTNSDTVSIHINDRRSRAIILSLTMTHENFAKALLGYGNMLADGEVYPSTVTGMDLVREDRHVKYPHDHFYRKEAEQWLEDHCQEEGWNVDCYLGSQSSKTYKLGEGYTLHYSVYKYVPRQ